MKKINIKKLFEEEEEEKTIQFEECYQYSGNWEGVGRMMWESDVIELFTDGNYKHRLYLTRDGELWRTKK